MRSPRCDEAATTEPRQIPWYVDVVGLVWVLGAAVAFLLPALLHGVYLGPFDFLSASGLPPHPGAPVHNLFDTDQITQMIPWTNLAWTQVHHGHLPLWNSYTALGTPLAFNWQSAVFSLPAVIGYLVPLRFDYTVQIVVTLFVTGSGVYVFGRVMRLSVVACVFGAVTAELGGTFVRWIGWPVASVMSWTGWALVAIVLIVRGDRRVRAVTIFSIILALAVYAGQPDTLVLFGVFLVTFTLVYLGLESVVGTVGVRARPSTPRPRAGLRRWICPQRSAPSARHRCTLQIGAQRGWCRPQQPACDPIQLSPTGDPSRNRWLSTAVVPGLLGGRSGGAGCGRRSAHASSGGTRTPPCRDARPHRHRHRAFFGDLHRTDRCNSYPTAPHRGGEVSTGCDLLRVRDRPLGRDRTPPDNDQLQASVGADHLGHGLRRGGGGAPGHLPGPIRRRFGESARTRMGVGRHCCRSSRRRRARPGATPVARPNRRRDRIPRHQRPSSPPVAQRTGTCPGHRVGGGRG